MVLPMFRRGLAVLGVGALLATVFLWRGTTEAAHAPLQTYNVDASKITVSGFSAGGFMAVQLHGAYSGTFRGAAVVSGGPYWCAEGSLIKAQGQCMETPESLNPTTYINKLKNTKDRDPWANLADDKVYLYEGAIDTTVDPPMGSKLRDYYLGFVSSSNLTLKNDLSSEHAMITDFYGNACDFNGSPWINNCSFDLAGTYLQHLYGTLNAKGTYDPSHMLEYNQTSGTHMVGTHGHIYVPASCASGTQCKLHVALHGCNQSPSNIGDQWYVKTGLNEWAETNNMIVMYPDLEGAPNNCWDWWGYTGVTKYYTRSGSQMKAIYNQVKTAAGL